MFVEPEGRRGPKAPPGATREAVRALVNLGMAPAEIAASLGVCKSTVAFHCRRLDLPPDPRFGRRYDWAAISRAYAAGLSMRQCLQRFGCLRDAWYQAVRRGDIELRPHEMPIESLLVVGRKTNRSHLKMRLLKAGLKASRCEECGLTEWRGKPLNMQLHHVNGDGMDNRLENLRLLCANCHSQTANYGGRNGHRKSQRPEAA